MNDKHFIWIIPSILVCGFVLGYISGLHIPKDITFGIDKDTLSVLNHSLNNCSNSYSFNSSAFIRSCSVEDSSLLYTACFRMICPNKTCDFYTEFNDTLMNHCQIRVYNEFFGENHVFEYKDYTWIE